MKTTRASLRCEDKQENGCSQRGAGTLAFGLASAEAFFPLAPTRALQRMPETRQDLRESLLTPAVRAFVSDEASSISQGAHRDRLGKVEPDLMNRGGPSRDFERPVNRALAGHAVDADRYACVGGVVPVQTAKDTEDAEARERVKKMGILFTPAAELETLAAHIVAVRDAMSCLDLETIVDTQGIEERLHRPKVSPSVVVPRNLNGVPSVLDPKPLIKSRTKTKPRVKSNAKPELNLKDLFTAAHAASSLGETPSKSGKERITSKSRSGCRLKPTEWTAPIGVRGFATVVRECGRERGGGLSGAQLAAAFHNPQTRNSSLLVHLLQASPRFDLEGLIGEGLVERWGKGEGEGEGYFVPRPAAFLSALMAMSIVAEGIDDENGADDGWAEDPQIVEQVRNILERRSCIGTSAETTAHDLGALLKYARVAKTHGREGSAEDFFTVFGTEDVEPFASKERLTAMFLPLVRIYKLQKRLLTVAQAQVQRSKSGVDPRGNLETNSESIPTWMLPLLSAGPNGFASLSGAVDKVERSIRDKEQFHIDVDDGNASQLFRSARKLMKPAVQTLVRSWRELVNMFLSSTPLTPERVVDIALHWLLNNQRDGHVPLLQSVSTACTTNFDVYMGDEAGLRRDQGDQAEPIGRIQTISEWPTVPLYIPRDYTNLQGLT